MPTPKPERIGRDTITEALRARIAEKDYPEDGKLAASEQELADGFGVNRLTMRAALAQLRTDGLIETRRGKAGVPGGIFVTTWRPIPRNSPARLSVEQWGSGRSIWQLDVDGRDLVVKEVVIEQLPAPDDVAASLDLAPDALVWRRGRRYEVDGEPVQHATSYYPAGLVEGSRITQVETGPGGTPARLRELGHGPVRHREELRTRSATARDRELLKLSRDVPIIDIVRVSWDESGLPVERTEMVLDGSRYVLGYDF